MYLKNPILHVSKTILNLSNNHYHFFTLGEEPIVKTGSLSNGEETLATTQTVPVLTDKPQIYIQEYDDDDDIESSVPTSSQQLLSFNDNFKLKPPRSWGSRRHSYTNTLLTVAEHITDE